MNYQQNAQDLNDDECHRAKFIVGTRLRFLGPSDDVPPEGLVIGDIVITAEQNGCGMGIDVHTPGGTIDMVWPWEVEVIMHEHTTRIRQITRPTFKAAWRAARKLVRRLAHANASDVMTLPETQVYFVSRRRVRYEVGDYAALPESNVRDLTRRASDAKMSSCEVVP